MCVKGFPHQFLLYILYLGFKGGLAGAGYGLPRNPYDLTNVMWKKLKMVWNCQ